MLDVVKKLTTRGISEKRAYKLKCFLCILAFTAIFLFADYVMGALMEKAKYSDKKDMNSLMWSDFYKQKPNNLDVIFLGSSHARVAFDTRTFDKELGIKTFNLSSADQSPLIGYFALKEALKYQKPKLLVYEAYWVKFGTSDNTTAAYFVYDYVKGIDIKLQMLAALSGDKKFKPFLQNALLKTYKYRDVVNLNISKIIKGRQAGRSTVRNSEVFGGFRYYGNGYFGSDDIAGDKKLYTANPFKKYQFTWNSRQEEYFYKCLDMCKNNGIKVLIVTAPMPLPTMNLIRDYKVYSDKIAGIAEEYGIEYIDFNIENVRNNTFPDKNFSDSNHLNITGAKLLDERLIPVVEKYLGELK